MEHMQVPLQHAISLISRSYLPISPYISPTSQPMHVVDPSAKTRVADLPPSEGEKPLLKLGGEKPLLKGQTQEGQLTGDRTSLVLQVSTINNDNNKISSREIAPRSCCR